ncbi:MAG: hypothetical protein K2H93_00290 [Oscillospiraceae bacterium]|nr:hypothetical protein [Oscillospiraceae bacterium]
MNVNTGMRKKAWILLILVVIAMLIPMKKQYNHGGMVKYTAIAYQIIKLHDDNACDMFQGSHWFGKKIGTEIRIFGMKVYDSVEFVPNNMDVVLSPAE